MRSRPSASATSTCPSSRRRSGRSSARVQQALRKPEEIPMIPASFNYIAAKRLEEAFPLLAKQKDAARVLAGGHSLPPAMKLRLMQPKVLIDLGRIKDLSYIKEEGG